MKMMTAIVRSKHTGEMTSITSEYKTKAAFRKDLRANGYTVIGRVFIDGEDSAKTRRYNRGCRR